jgi:hypothetical protein
MPSTRAERGAHDDLPLAGGGPREHQQRDVAAHEDEEQPRDEVDRNGRDSIGVGQVPGPELCLDVWEHAAVEVLVHVGSVDAGPRDQHIQLGPSLLDAPIGSETPEHHHGRASERRERGAVEPKGDPELLAAGKSEPARHHPDHSVRHAAETDGPADHVGVRAEPVLPHVVPDDGHVLRPRRLVSDIERPTHQRSHTRHAEGGGGHRGRADRVSGPLTCGKVGSQSPCGSEILDG